MNYYEAMMLVSKAILTADISEGKKFFLTYQAGVFQVLNHRLEAPGVQIVCTLTKVDITQGLKSPLWHRIERQVKNIIVKG